MYRLLSTAMVFSAAVMTTPVMADSIGLLVENVTSAEGDIYAAVVTEPNFPSVDNAVVAARVKAAVGSVELLLGPLPAGDYAILVFQDVNGNGELDSNFIGIPNEPVAMSNNHVPRFGPPSFDKARFTMGDEPLALQVDLVD